MLRRLLLSAVLLGLTTLGVAAQQAQVGTRVYTALFKVGYSDLTQWVADYDAEGVPILEALVSDGLLVGFDLRTHHTGGEYNIRQAFIGADDTDFEAVWETYLGRLEQENPAAFQRSNRAIQAHTDEIWNIDVSTLPAGAGTQYMYDAQFQVNFADLDRWNELWAQDVFPALDRAMEDGLLQGYVVEGHNTGGRFNWKILYFYDEWDNLDELEAALFGAIPLDHPIWELPTGHIDELWQAPPAM